MRTSLTNLHNQFHNFPTNLRSPRWRGAGLRANCWFTIRIEPNTLSFQGYNCNHCATAGPSSVADDSFGCRLLGVIQVNHPRATPSKASINHRRPRGARRGAATLRPRAPSPVAYLRRGDSATGNYLKSE
ncbi:hypothetical protein EVAR_25874_1 [Eumeta japonica]|uniref:Uncharacterized protein n=1 Tax=Eumeta variegata TaxID=151549 RepID=A0A4C1X4Y5_EUMVA|nr:hypothetical protein EVAR_25874_1 [Eumeta japonica]